MKTLHYIFKVLFWLSLIVQTFSVFYNAPEKAGYMFGWFVGVYGIPFVFWLISYIIGIILKKKTSSNNESHEIQDNTQQ